MVRWRVAQLLKDREWTAYRLAQEAGLTVPAAYRLAKRNVPVMRIDADTLERLCIAFGVTPGDLLEIAPDRKVRRGG